LANNLIKLRFFVLASPFVSCQHQ